MSLYWIYRCNQFHQVDLKFSKVLEQELTFPNMLLKLTAYMKFNLLFLVELQKEETHMKGRQTLRSILKKHKDTPPDKWGLSFCISPLLVFLILFVDLSETYGDCSFGRGSSLCDSYLNVFLAGKVVLKL